jgi:plasmid maintenance system antidote protein VapI
MAQLDEQHVDAAFLRGKLAEHRLPIFVVAARIRVHPRRVGEMLNGHRPLPPELAAKILQAIEQE